MGPAALKNDYWLLRHGRSLANVAEIIISKPENGVLAKWDLAPAGEEQAHAAGQKLRAALEAAGTYPTPIHVFASPFSRTQRTARLALEAAGLTAEVQTAPELRERFFGDELEEQPYGKAYGIIWEHDAHSTAYRPGGNGESVEEVSARLHALYDRIEASMSGQTVLLVSHGDTLSIMQATMLTRGDEGHHRKFAFETAELRRLGDTPAHSGSGGH